MIKNKAFTLIELLVVISIISLLASVIFSSVASARDKAKVAKIKTSLHALSSEMEIYYLDNDSSYDGGCISANNIIVDITETGGDPRCYDNENNWAIETKLENGEYLGANNTGFVGLSDGTQYAVEIVGGDNSGVIGIVAIVEEDEEESVQSFIYLKCSDFKESWNSGPLNTYDITGSIVESFSSTSNPQTKARDYCNSVCEGYGYYNHILGSDYVSPNTNYYCMGPDHPPQALCGQTNGSTNYSLAWNTHTHSQDDHPMDLGSGSWTQLIDTSIGDYCTAECSSATYSTFLGGSSTFYYCL